jgi:hypothetical protein
MSKFKKIPMYAYHCGNTEFFNFVKTKLLIKENYCPVIDKENKTISFNDGNVETYDSYIKFMEEIKEINGTIAQYNKEFNKQTRKMIKSRMVPQSWIDEFKSKTRQLSEGAGTKLSQFKDILSKAVSKETEGVDYIIMNGVKQYI